MAKLLIVDDDPVLLQMLKEHLQAQSWSVEVATNCGDALQLLNNFGYDLVILDWSLPDGQGPDVCAQYRAQGGSSPVLFLTGKSDMDSKVHGLGVGDDYLTKPFDIRELIARVAALLSRPAQFTSRNLEINGVKLDANSLHVIYSGKPIRISQTEFSILEYFFRRPNQIISSVKLFESVWPSDTQVNDDTVRVHMHILRRKLALAGLKDFIKTVRGSGYILEAPP
jgi:two-component system OmpR family response regulator